MLCLALAAGCISSRPPPRRAPVELKPHVEPELQGVTHVVKPGETLWRIAKAYQVTVEDLMVANQVADGKLSAGQRLFVPGAKASAEVPPADLPPPTPSPYADGKAPLQWPMYGVLYARFGPRGDTRHDGVDIAGPDATQVVAAADGEVLFAGEQKGYGFVVVIQHTGSLITLYAHTRDAKVKEGQRVKAGQAIATVGEASRTSGPHIHFEVRENGLAKDPLKYLPAPR